MNTNTSLNGNNPVYSQQQVNLSTASPAKVKQSKAVEGLEKSIQEIQQKILEEKTKVPGLEKTLSGDRVKLGTEKQKALNMMESKIYGSIEGNIEYLGKKKEKLEKSLKERPVELQKIGVTNQKIKDLSTSISASIRNIAEEIKGQEKDKIALPEKLKVISTGIVEINKTIEKTAKKLSETTLRIEMLSGKLQVQIALRDLNMLVGEFQSTEKSFLDGAVGLEKLLGELIKESPEDLFLKAYHDEVKNAVVLIGKFNENLRSNLEVDGDLSQKMKALGAAYKDPNKDPIFEVYSESLLKLNRMFLVLQSMSKDYPKLTAAASKIHPIIFTQRIMRHPMLLKELVGKAEKTAQTITSEKQLIGKTESEKKAIVDQAKKIKESSVNIANASAAAVQNGVRVNNSTVIGDIIFGLKSAFEGSIAGSTFKGLNKPLEKFKDDKTNGLKVLSKRVYSQGNIKEFLESVQGLSQYLPRASKSEQSFFRDQLVHYMYKYTKEYTNEFKENIATKSLDELKAEKANIKLFSVESSAVAPMSKKENSERSAALSAGKILSTLIDNQILILENAILVKKR